MFDLKISLRIRRYENWCAICVFICYIVHDAISRRSGMKHNIMESSLRESQQKYSVIYPTPIRDKFI